MDSQLYSNILHYIITQSYSNISDKNEKRMLRRTASKYIVIGEKLHLKTINDDKPMVIQEVELPKILKEIHDDVGHQGMKYTISLAKGRYYWPNIMRTIENYVKNCERCCMNQYSLKRPTEPLKPLPVISKPWYRVGMDLTGPLIESNGYKYILTMVDHFTKWVETRPLRSKETTEVAKGIFSIYCSKGAPVQIISDNGGEFTSKLMAELQEQYSCHLIFSAPYHPQTNGLVEAYHKGIKSYLSKTLAEKSERWSECLEQITFSVNIRPRLDTTGFSAFELMHGFRRARIPTEATNLFELHEGSSDVLNLDTSLCEDNILQEFNQKIEDLKQVVFEKASKNLLLSKEKMKRSFDKNLNSKVVSDLQVGDSVLIPNRKRRKGDLEDLWQGPYPIKKANLDTVVVVKGEGEQRIKKSQVKLWKIDKTQSIANESDLEDSKAITQLHTVKKDGTYDVIEEQSIDLLEEEIDFTDSEDNTEDSDLILKTLNSMKNLIQDSISANTYLSVMHSELDKRQDLSLKKIIDWKDCNFPNAQSISYNSNKIIEKLIKWFKEAKKADVKYWLVTDQDRDNALYWGQRAVDYVAKVLFPVVSNLIASKIGENSDLNKTHDVLSLPETLTNEISTSSIETNLKNSQTANNPILTGPIDEIFNIDIESLCPNWGGFYNSVRMDNTCPIDNIFTILSINITTIFNLIDSKEVSISEECSKLFEMIKLREFNEAKFWLANKLNKPKLKGNRYDFYGTEGSFIEFLCSATGSDVYEVPCTCWDCFTIQDRTLNLTSAYKFIVDCQTTIDHQINSTSCRHCKQKGSIVEKSDGKFIRLPLLFMLEVGHLSLSDINVVNKTILISHNNSFISFRLLGYTIHSAEHFYLRCLIKDEYYTYDGIKRPKMSKTDLVNLKQKEVINTIFYIFTPNTEFNK